MPTRNDGERRRVLRFERLDVIIALGARRADQPGDARRRRQAAARARADRASTRSQAPTTQFGRLVGGGAALAFAVALLASGASSSSVGTYAGQVVMAGFIGLRIPLLVRRAVTMLPALIILAIGVSTDRRARAQPGRAVVRDPVRADPARLLTGRRDVMGAHVNGRVTAVSRRGARRRSRR